MRLDRGMTAPRIWCSLFRVDASEVMRLIDLIADLETPSAAELRAFADRALVQVQTVSLRVGIATEGGRPITDILSLVDSLGVKRDVWSISSIDRPTGVDAWIIVPGDPPNDAAERRFTDRLGDVEMALVDDPALLRGTLERWIAEKDALRSRVLSSQARPALEALARDHQSLGERLGQLPDPEEAERARAAYQQRSSVAIDAVRQASGEVITELREEVLRCFSDWVDTVTANHGELPSRDRVEASLEKWLRDRFAATFAERLGRRVSIHAENLPELAAALTALRTAEVADFTAPAVALPASAPAPAARWLIPVAAGAVGYWRGGPKLALIGAAVGMLTARAIRKSAKKPLEDPALRTAAADHVAAHLHTAEEHLLAGLRADCELARARLAESAESAARTRPERTRLAAALEQLDRAREIIQAS